MGFPLNMVSSEKEKNYTDVHTRPLKVSEFEFPAVSNETNHELFGTIDQEQKPARVPTTESETDY